MEAAQTQQAQPKSVPQTSKTGDHDGTNKIDLSRVLRLFADDIKIAHTIFAMPFAMSVFFLADIGWPGFTPLLTILVCMVSARSFAMGMNRYFDRHIDAKHARTSQRAIPSGSMQAWQMLALSAASGVIFIWASGNLNDIAAICSVPLLGILAGYSLTKRFTHWCHLYLGMCLALAPIAITVALGKGFGAAVVFLSLGVMLWTAGFDAIYSAQDMENDREQGLFSLPASKGFAGAMLYSRCFFVGMIASLCLSGWFAGMGRIYYSGVGLIAAFLAAQHILIPDAQAVQKKPKLHFAFFTANAYISLLFLLFCAADHWLG